MPILIIGCSANDKKNKNPIYFCRKIKLALHEIFYPKG